jgi:hypothetical protein
MAWPGAARQARYSHSHDVHRRTSTRRHLIRGAHAQQRTGTLYAILDKPTHVQVCVCAFLSIGHKCAVTYRGGTNWGRSLQQRSLASITSPAAFLLEIGIQHTILDMSTHVQVCVSALLSVGDKCAVTYKDGKNGGRSLQQPVVGFDYVPRCISSGNRHIRHNTRHVNACSGMRFCVIEHR